MLSAFWTSAWPAGDGKVTLQDVAGLVGAVDDDFLLEFHGGVIKGEAGHCLVLLDRLLNTGKEPRQFLSDLILFYRNLVLLQLGGVTGEIIALSPETKDRYEDAARQLSREQLMAAVKSLSQTEGEIKWTTQPRILLEMGILQLLDAWKMRRTGKRSRRKKLFRKSKKWPEGNGGHSGNRLALNPGSARAGSNPRKGSIQEKKVLLLSQLRQMPYWTLISSRPNGKAF
ncbi:MAG: hypothetical protein ACOX37_04665 [Bacillota bacterium]